MEATAPKVKAPVSRAPQDITVKLEHLLQLCVLSELTRQMGSMSAPLVMKGTTAHREQLRKSSVQVGSTAHRVNRYVLSVDKVILVQLALSLHLHAHQEVTQNQRHTSVKHVPLVISVLKRLGLRLFVHKVNLVWKVHQNAQLVLPGTPVCCITKHQINALGELTVH
jgi:hypothetical protein